MDDREKKEKAGPHFGFFLRPGFEAVGLCSSSESFQFCFIWVRTTVFSTAKGPVEWGLVGLGTNLFLLLRLAAVPLLFGPSHRVCGMWYYRRVCSLGKMGSRLGGKHFQRAPTGILSRSLTHLTASQMTTHRQVRFRSTRPGISMPTGILITCAL